MADNVTANSGSGGAVFATDDIGGVHYPITKVTIGALDAQTLLTGGTGVVGAGCPRVTLATDVALPTGSNVIGAVTQSGTWNVTDISGTVSLPTGASTAAKQPALGTAGTASADVISVQGIASMTPILATVTGTATVSQATGTNLHMVVDSGTVTNLSQLGGQVITMGAGAHDGGTQRVTVSTDDDVRVLGAVAHDSADSGAPVKIGARAVAALSSATMVAAADRTDLIADIDGAVITRNGVPLGDLLQERASNTDGASTAFTTFGATASSRNMITSVTIHNAHASTNGYVDLRDGTAGSVIWTFPAPATGGATHNFDPPLRQPTANTALAFDASAAITTIYISVNGYKSKV